MYPISLEAVLTTEEVLFAYLLARWALQSIGIFVTVCSGALAHDFINGIRHFDILRGKFLERQMYDQKGLFAIWCSLVLVLTIPSILLLR